MQYAPATQGTPRAVLDLLKRDYFNLLESHSIYSVRELLNSDVINLDFYCTQYRIYPEVHSSIAAAKQFGEKYGIWLPSTSTSIQCAFLLYPGADFQRMLTIIKNLVIGFYLNDTIGRDLFRFLTPEEQKNARRMIERMTGTTNEHHFSE